MVEALLLLLMVGLLLAVLLNALRRPPPPQVIIVQGTGWDDSGAGGCFPLLALLAVVLIAVATSAG